MILPQTFSPKSNIRFDFYALTFDILLTLIILFLIFPIPFIIMSESYKKGVFYDYHLCLLFDQV